MVPVAGAGAGAAVVAASAASRGVFVRLRRQRSWFSPGREEHVPLLPRLTPFVSFLRQEHSQDFDE